VRIFELMSSSASSQETRSKDAAPFRPVRTSGCRTRSVLYTRRSNRRTFPQMYPFVEGARWLPSILTMAPRSTVTERLQLSGQSSGHAVVTVDRPHDNGGSIASLLMS
jgi:hypothetical protein